MKNQAKANNEKFQSGGVATIAASHAVHDTYAAFLAPLLPEFITKLALSKTEAGILTMFVRGPSLFQPIMGHLADKLSLKYFVILAPAVTAIMMSLLGIAPSYAIIAFLLVVAGTSSAAFHAVAPAMAGKLSGNNLGRGMGFWMFGGELGRALGPIVVVTTIGLVSLRGLPWLIPVGLLASFLLYLKLRTVEETPRQVEKGLPWMVALRRMRPIMLPLVGLLISRSFIHAGMTVYLPTYLTEEGSNLWLAGASLSILEAAGVAGAISGGWISDHIGRRKVLAASLFGTSIFSMIFLNINGWYQFPILLLLGFTTLSVTPVIMAIVQEGFPENRAFANGVYMSLNFTIRSGAVIIVGILGDHFGLNFALSLGAVVILFGLIFIFILPKEKNSQHKRSKF